MTESHTQTCVILVTTGSEAEAETIAIALLKEQLVACVNIISSVRSLYRWEGKIADDREWLLVIKTENDRFAAVESRVRELHSYDVPEVIGVPVRAGSAAYLDWIHQETRAKP